MHKCPECGKDCDCDSLFFCYHYLYCFDKVLQAIWDNGEPDSITIVGKTDDEIEETVAEIKAIAEEENDEN